LCGRRSHQKPVSIFKALRTPRRSLCDNVIDVSQFRFQYWPRNADHSRRIGLGITWLVDVLVMLGLTYGSDRSISLGADIIRCICHSAHRIDCACKRKNKIPLFRTPQVFAEPLHPSLPQDIQDGISAHGIGDIELVAFPARRISSGVPSHRMTRRNRRRLRPTAFAATAVTAKSPFFADDKLGAEVDGRHSCARRLFLNWP
jgi:hypothetical protein